MTPDSKLPADGKAGDPRPPMQVYPPPQSSDPTVTSTNVRLMREDILAELNQDEGQFILPLRTRLALLALLSASLCIIILMTIRRDPPIQQAQQSEPPRVQVPQVPVVPKSAEKKAEKTAQPSVPAKSAAKLPDELVKVEILAKVIREDKALDPLDAIKRLKPFAESSDPVVQQAGKQALAAVYSQLDERTRSQVRVAAESAEDLIEKQDFQSAIALLNDTKTALPAEAPWTEHAAKDLDALIAKTGKQREDTLRLSTEGLEDALRGGSADARDKLQKLLAHPDPSFRQQAETLKAKLAEELARQLAEKQKRDADARIAWTEFFQKFDVAMSAGNFAQAQALCKREPNDPILSGGVGDPKAVLEGFSGEVPAIQNLYDAALNRARDIATNGTVAEKSMTLSRRNNMVPFSGSLTKVEGRTLKLTVSIDGVSGETSAKIDELAARGLETLLGLEGSKTQAAPLHSLQAFESRRTATETLAKLSGNKELPMHWAERVKLENFKKADDDLKQKLAELNTALGGESDDAIKTTLEAARIAAAAYEKFEPLAETQQKSIDTAIKRVGNSVRGKVILQNNVSPSADFVGITTDLIDAYKEGLHQRNVGAQFGLKVGAAAGLKRILIRFEGIEAALQKSKIKKATLELYQIESEESGYKGAVVCIYRLKRPWVPDAGSWMCYDELKKLNWSLPGADGDADIEAKDDARVIIDSKHDVWRSWDVTDYVKDVLTGKRQNYGFLMRVINDEPSHQVRFYPEKDLDAKKDKSLRPRLVLEVEKSE
jgi:hypothetical protein